MKKYAKIFLVMLFVLCLSFGTILLLSGRKEAFAQSVTDLDGIDYNGTTVVSGSDRYIAPESYIIPNGDGYNISSGEQKYAFSNGEKSVPFANFYVDTINGGSVLKGNNYHGVGAYGYIAGEGETIYDRDDDGNIKKDDDDNDIILAKNYVDIKLQYNFATLNMLPGSDGELCQIADDGSNSSINGLPSFGTIGKGALVIQKFVPTAEKEYPTSDSDYTILNHFNNKETFGYHTVNFFEEFNPENHKTPFSVYQPSGQDLKNGVFIKITVAYKLAVIKTTPAKIDANNGIFEFPKQQTYFQSVIEQTTFYLCNTSAEVIFENLYFSSGSSDEKAEKPETIVKQEEGAISNNQGSKDGFKLNLNGNDYIVEYRFNDSSNFTPCTDGQVFSEVGKYDFIITTKLGMKRKKTVYIHETTEEKNLDIYFGDGLVSGKRIFAPTDIYPVYLQDGLTLSTPDENRTFVKHAPLVGRVYLLDGNWETAPRNEEDKLPKTGLVCEKTADNHSWSVSGLKPGNYEAIFANNEEYFDHTATGDTFVFVWRFSVMETGNTSVVNQQILEGFAGISDYSSLHYEIVLNSAGAGNVRVVFGDETSAYNFACQYFASTVKKEGTNFIFDGKTYQKESEMISALHKKARTIIERQYFDLTDINSYLTLKESVVVPVITDNSSEEEIADYNNFVSILKRSYDKDVRVFSGDYASEFTMGTPFLNDRAYAYLGDSGLIERGKHNVYFISVADYESEKITLVHKESGKTFVVPYGVAVETFLELNVAPTGLYTVREQNAYGVVEYSAVYIRKGEITTEITLERMLNNATTTHVLTRLDNNIHLRANNVRITDVVNDLDPFGLIKISKVGGSTSIYEITELESLPVLDEEGNYVITIVDRLGNSANFYIDIFRANKFYNFKLQDKSDTILSELAYGGKVFILPTLISSDENFEFAGWEDENGNVYKDKYTFNTPQDVTLKAVWHYSSVNIEVYDGDKIASYSQKVGKLQALPRLTKSGYRLFGYKFVQADKTVRFYRGQINRVPNVSSMRLDAIWMKTDASSISPSESLTIHLVDGSELNTLPGSKDGKIQLPKLTDTQTMKFVGWIYEYQLSGVIFTDEMSFAEVEAVGLADENDIKLNAIWVSATSQEKSLFAGTISPNNQNKLWNFGLYKLIALALALLGVQIAKRAKKKRHQVSKNKLAACLNAPTKVAVEPQKASKAEKQTYVNPERHRINRIKFYKKIFTPFVLILMSVVMLVMSQDKLMYSLKTCVDETNATNAQQAALTEMLSDTRTPVAPTQPELAAAQAVIKEAFYPTNSASLEVNASDEATEEISDDEAFLYTLVFKNLMEFGYDVFPATIEKNNVTYSGLGYTEYGQIYIDKDDHLAFNAGFINFKDDLELTEEEISSGIEITSHSVDKNEVKYYLAISENISPIGYVAFDKYVLYRVENSNLIYSFNPNDGYYFGTDFDVFNYDTGEICHYGNYDSEFKSDFYTLSEDVGYDEIAKILKEFSDEQDKAGAQINIEQANYISYQALTDYVVNGQSEKVLGLNPDELLYYEANISDAYYFAVMDDGTIQTFELSPEKKASLWERIWVGLASVGGVVVGVLTTLIPGVGPFIGAGIVGASLDVFMQVTAFGTAPENINVLSVVVSGVTGIISAGIGGAATAITKTALKGIKSAVLKFLIEGGIQLISGAISGMVTYLISSLAFGQELSFKDCMKAVMIGGVTSAIMFCGKKIIGAIGKKIAKIKAEKTEIISTDDERFQKALLKAQNGDPAELQEILNKRATKIAEEVRAEHPEWSKMRQGTEIHKRMRYTITTTNEFDLKSFGRADGIDQFSQIIFELKPETANSMRAGLKQLTRYEQGARLDEDLQHISNWIKILITYEQK